MAQETGNLPTQMERSFISLSGQNEILNTAGGYVFKVDDVVRLQRLVTIGTEEGKYHAQKFAVTQENASCVVRLLDKGYGEEIVRFIKDVSVNRRNLRQNSLLLVLAICARSKHKCAKKAAYEALSDICRIPTFLFMFIKFCEEESQLQGGTTGWGRAHKKAISRWYTNFTKNPLKLAHLVAKYKNREGWTHKDVLRLAHTRCKRDKAIGYILSYIVKGYKVAHEKYISKSDNTSEESQVLERLAALFHGVDEASKCATADHLCYLINEHHLSWEMCSTTLLTKPQVWKDLLKYMPIEATIKNLGKMTSYGLFAANSEDEELVLEKIRSINSDKGVMEHGNSDEEYRIGKDYLHPFQILLAYTMYKTGHGDNGYVRWVPNDRILTALDVAFYEAFKYVEPTNQKYLLAVDVSGSMTQPVLGSRTIHCNEAAAAMLMVTARIERNYIIKGFGNTLFDIDISKMDKLEDIMKKTRNATTGGTDCALPMMYAMEAKIPDVDVFVVYTSSETWYGKVHPAEALRQYRQYGNKTAKLIVCGMCSTDFSIADPDDPLMLDVVGFDSLAPHIISKFVLEQLPIIKPTP